MSRRQESQQVNDRLADVLAVHFDAKWGTPFWLERARTLGFDPRDAVRCIQDLPRMGTMTQADLLDRPLEHFIPKSVLEKRTALRVAQTGGTTGQPVWTAYAQDEFIAAFVEPFAVAAAHVHFPTGGAWLYVGPSGPHIIGQAAREIARRSQAASPFCVDFDSRWARKLPDGSFASARYVAHILDQSLDIIRRQNITTLFCTPLILSRLSQQMSSDQRERTRGVHYGGTAINPDHLHGQLRDSFPNAVHLCGYGNTLFGCCLELNCSPGRQLQYFPYGPRLIFAVDPAASADKPAVDYDTVDQRGRVIFTRLDRTMLLVNMCERDEGVLTPPPEHAPSDFALCGIASPKPIRGNHTPAADAIY